jgi:dTMP kinase
VRGRLITIEGLDGAGKTTLATSLQEKLRERGIEVELLREPGGVAAAERIRELVKDPSMRIGGRAEALLYAAARAQLVEESLEPLLETGTWVLLDRFVDSSLAYQGAGRDLGVEAVGAVNRFATKGLVPDRTLLLAIDPATGLNRAGARPGDPDRLEQEEKSFFESIAAAYAEFATADPHRIRTIDASKSQDMVLATALKELEDLL